MTTKKKKKTAMTEQEEAALRSLRDRGYAVCVFTPEERQYASQEKVEDEMRNAGLGIIKFFRMVWG